MKILQLLGTPGCHLCELAEDLLADLLSRGCDWEIELVDIADSDALIERYGVRIPVLLDIQAGTELGWPFDQQQVLEFVGEVE